MVPKNPTGASAIAGSNFPTDVQEILASIDREFPKMHDRRVIPRWVFHAEAFLTIDHSVRHQLWTRDVNAWNIGFVSRQPIELGAQGTLRIEVPSGEIIVVPAQVKRCRQFTPGWYEGYVNFLQPVPDELIEKTRA